jgi:hypothetical protein
VWVKVNPLRTHNKRTTLIRSLESLARKTRNQLVTDTVKTAGVSINGFDNGMQGPRLHTGVAFTMQYAQHSARLTITGTYKTTDTFRATSNRDVDAQWTDRVDDNYDGEPGKWVSGPYGAWNPLEYQTVSSEILAEVSAFKGIIETASPDIIDGNITRIEYAGFFFGQGGFSIPA